MTVKAPRKLKLLPPTVVALLGAHPAKGAFFGDYLDHQDVSTTGQTPHRILAEGKGARAGAVATLRSFLTQHHASAEQLQRSKEAREAFENQGLPVPKALRRYPISSTTQKGNFAEIVLAEYVAAAGQLKLPVYRLRHNPNVDQSMKGDDVLGFDLDATPVRVVVGEAKFRKVSTDGIVDEIVTALKTSYLGGVPTSLQFVADQVKDEKLAEKIMACGRLFAEKKLRLDYVGLFLSDAKASTRVAAHGKAALRRLVLVSLGVSDPETLVATCFEKLV